MKKSYFKPNLNGHKILYRGRRYWIFKVSQKYPYKGSEKIDDIVVYDGVHDLDVCYFHENKDGSYEGIVTYGQNDLNVKGSDIKSFLKDVTKTIKWCERN